MADTRLPPRSWRVLACEDHGDLRTDHCRVGPRNACLCPFIAVVESKTDSDALLLWKEACAREEKLRTALEDIARTDYRGNEPTERMMARRALEETPRQTFPPLREPTSGERDAREQMPR